jgi:hypothetical protein
MDRTFGIDHERVALVMSISLIPLILFILPEFSLNAAVGVDMPFPGYLPFFIRPARYRASDLSRGSSVKNWTKSMRSRWHASRSRF